MQFMLYADKPDLVSVCSCRN